MKSFACILLCLLLTACATETAVQPETPQTLFNDALFKPPAERINPADIFALDRNMQNFLETEVKHKIFYEGKLEALYDGLYSKNSKKFSYDAVQTNTASEVFRLRSGNCLSYTIMTAAFAKQLHLSIQFHQVDIGEVWDRSNNIDYRIGHVNLSLGDNFAVNREPPKLFDITNDGDSKSNIQEDIGEDVVVAMYMNNHAAEALAKNDLDTAYWWARAAVEYTPAYMPAYNTLGVIYLRHQNLAQSSRVFGRVLAREPDNVPALSNQAQVMDKMGRDDEAKKIRSRLAQIEPYPPYYFFNRGLDEMRMHDFRAAKADFTKEVNRASYNHQFHFWLALADYYLGDLGASSMQLEVAMENSPNTQQRDLYAAKLEKLKERMER